MISNIEFLGKVNYNSLPQLISTFNVGIIPLEQSDKVYKLNSAKFLQYLAANIPIVSVPFYEFLEFKENVHFCDSRIEFIKSIDYILNSKNQSDIKYENLENWDWNKISGSASIHIN